MTTRQSNGSTFERHKAKRSARLIRCNIVLSVATFFLLSIETTLSQAQPGESVLQRGLASGDLQNDNTNRQSTSEPFLRTKRRRPADWEASTASVPTQTSLLPGASRRQKQQQQLDSGGIPAASPNFEAAFQGECNQNSSNNNATQTTAPTGSNPCEHICLDLHDGTYECSCFYGFALAVDGYSCAKLPLAAPQLPQPPETGAPTRQQPAPFLAEPGKAAGDGETRPTASTTTVPSADEQKQQQQRLAGPRGGPNGEPHDDEPSESAEQDENCDQETGAPARTHEARPGHQQPQRPRHLEQRADAGRKLGDTDHGGGGESEILAGATAASANNNNNNDDDDDDQGERLEREEPTSGAVTAQADNVQEQQSGPSAIARISSAELAFELDPRRQQWRQEEQQQQDSDEKPQGSAKQETRAQAAWPKYELEPSGPELELDANGTRSTTAATLVDYDEQTNKNQQANEIEIEQANRTLDLRQIEREKQRRRQRTDQSTLPTTLDVRSIMLANDRLAEQLERALGLRRAKHRHRHPVQAPRLDYDLGLLGRLVDETIVPARVQRQQ